MQTSLQISGQRSTYDYLHESKKFIDPRDFRKIHHDARMAVLELKTKEAEVIKALQKVDQYKVYRFLGFNSLFQYALSLGLSEHQSYSYITVARKSVECPALQQAIENKEITVSKAKAIASVVEEKNQTHWLELAKTLPKRELEREIARVSPKAIKKESSRFITDTVLELNVTVSEDTFKLLERVKDIMAQKAKKHITLEDALSLLAKDYVNKHDPVKKAERNLEKSLKRNRKRGLEGGWNGNRNKHSNTSRSQLVPGRVTSASSTRRVPYNPTGRNPLTAQIKHQVFIRDRGQCQYRNTNNQLCLEKKWIDIHHIIPVSKGGTNTLENLTTLCKGHHAAVHGSTRISSAEFELPQNLNYF